jgi:hypothetical protein
MRSTALISAALASTVAQNLDFEYTDGSICTISMESDLQLHSSCNIQQPVGVSNNLEERLSALENALMSGYHCTTGKTIAGGDMAGGSGTASTQAECQTACTSTTGCTAFTMPGCQLKSTITTTTSGTADSVCKKTLLAPVAAYGASAEDALHSCNHLLQAGVTASGPYFINPTGNNAVKVYCDMVTDGGGWTLVHKTNKADHSDDQDWNAAGGYNLGGLLTSANNAVAVLPRADMLALSASPGSVANAYNSEIRIIKDGGASSGYQMYYKGIPYYASDNHQVLYDMGYSAGANYGGWMTTLEVKDSYSGTYSTGNDVRLEINAQHGPCLGYAVGSSWGKHVCTKRNCCGTMGVGGIW